MRNRVEIIETAKRIYEKMDTVHGAELTVVAVPFLEVLLDIREMMMAKMGLIPPLTEPGPEPPPATPAMRNSG